LAAFLEKNAGVAQARVLGLHQLNDVHIDQSDLCISLIETEHESLATLSPEAMDSLRAVTNTVTDLLWLTGANMLGKIPDPNLTLSSGLSRALMLEQPTLRWSVLDIGSSMKQLADQVHANHTCSNVVRAVVARYERDDCEFISVDGLLNVSRYYPDFGVNSLFRQRLEAQSETEKQTLGSIGSARLSIGRPGATDTIYFQQLCELEQTQPPAAGYVEIEVKAVSLNAKDVYAMSGRVETREVTTGFDFSGIVTAVGSTTSEQPFQIGDRVVACAPFHIGTTARVPASCVHRLLEHEEYTVVPTLLLAYATALYALNDCTHLRAGESVLIHAGSGGVGIAAIALAQQIGAKVYTTCSSPAKRDYLINELGVDPDHIFSSRDASFVPAILAATDSHGVDVIINSLVGDLMHDGWQKCLADFGRFVEIGKRELLDAGRLDMRTFLRNATFTAFDLSDLFHSKSPFSNATWDRLVAETLELYRAGKIKPPPMEVFDVTRVAQAYRFFAHKDRVGKVVISMENPQARVPVSPANYLTLFDPKKVYLLIGCLGGLGRSLSRWMMTRGARNFVFVGRSGADRPSAQQLVSRLEQNGANIDVVRGDVSSAADIKKAVEVCAANGRQIGGVIQAAMGLHEALFTKMSNDAWCVVFLFP
jgi:NADPH:quinone reductase-like Zn-dependent oxidoreductase